MIERKVALSTGITMNIALAGPEDAPPAILLHGFPETHRTWTQVAERLKDDVHLIMPDLRGFGGSDRPQDVAAYATDTLVADVLALADALGIDDFVLVGHDWGGAVNSPHPWIFQKSLIDDADQRAASQYITAFRAPGMEMAISAMGVDTFFNKSFTNHAGPSEVPAGMRERSIAEWRRPGALTAMFNWYRASPIVVPPPGVTVPIPDWVLRLAPRIEIPVRVIWGLDDKALLPVQLDGIGEVGGDVEVIPLPSVGHFATWQAPERVADALRPFLAAR